MSKIYVASSWRNKFQPEVVSILRKNSHSVYDFRNPPNNSGFGWEALEIGDKPWSVETYKRALNHPIACQGYLADMRGMIWADVCVLVLPCGRSAHLEGGWFAGNGKRLIILTQDGEEPELMALMATDICSKMTEVISVLAA